MAELRCAYLIAGDDDAKIDAWRSRLRRRAEQEGGPGALEHFDAGVHGPGDVAAALATLSLIDGPRYLLADGVETWKPGVTAPLEHAVRSMPPATTLVLVARGKPSASLQSAVEAAGGEVRVYEAPKPWKMPQWVAERAIDCGLHLDAEAAKALVGVVGTGQHRLAREVEKLALAAHPSTQLTADEVRRLATGESPAQAYDLADAVVAGEPVAALALAEELRSHEDRPGRLVWPVVRRLREVHRAARLLDAGVSEKDVAKALRAAPWAAKRTIAQAKKADRQALERALCLFADLELELRGAGELDEDTAFSLAVARATS
jgi:DNA polymerase III subunit delta